MMQQRKYKVTVELSVKARDAVKALQVARGAIRSRQVVEQRVVSIVEEEIGQLSSQGKS